MLNTAIAARLAGLLLLLGAAACASNDNPSHPFSNPKDVGGGPAPLLTLEEGVYRLPPDNADAALRLDQHPEVHVLVLGEVDPNRISDAHMRALHDWVQKGGVLWVEGRTVGDGELKLVLPVKADEFDFRKTTTGDRAGELVVKGSSERMVIHDSPLTRNVNELYLYPRFRFDGTPGLQPLVEMTDAKGNHGVVLGQVPIGSGMVVLDGTARKSRFLFGRIAGFDPSHPNAVEQNGSWNSYDWNRLVANARNLANAGGDTGTGQTTPEPR